MSSSGLPIKVEGLRKKYKLYRKKKELLKELFDPFRRKFHTEFWALDGVDFEINSGETVGIIGKNGAGKSTLLKIITGVLSPTNGKVTTRGRISSLLELGAGFNPEYTGIENIYLQGIIGGFSKEEMTRKLGAILEFADIGEFVHQKVRGYSSGMYARLAFAVAINTEPDILIVDEALSVGDMRFQQKCYRKFGELQAAGVTILFVTHDIQMIKSYCSRVIWISDGKKIDDGAPENVCRRYTAEMSYDMSSKINTEVNKSDSQNNGQIQWTTTQGVESFGERGAEIVSVAIYELDTQESRISYKSGDMVKIELLIETYQKICSPGVGIIFKDRVGNQIFGIGNYIYDIYFEDLLENTRSLVCVEFCMPPIQNGSYSVSMALSEGTQENHTQHHWIHDVLSISIHNDDIAFRIGNQLVIEKQLVKMKAKTIDGK